jgi:hypothetical protein
MKQNYICYVLNLNCSMKYYSGFLHYLRLYTMRIFLGDHFLNSSRNKNVTRFIHQIFTFICTCSREANNTSCVIAVVL